MNDFKNIFGDGKKKSDKSFYFKSSDKKKKKKKKKKSFEKSFENVIPDSNDTLFDTPLEELPDVKQPYLVEVIVKIYMNDKLNIGLFTSILYPNKIMVDVVANKSTYESIIERFNLPLSVENLKELAKDENSYMSITVVPLSECGNVDLISSFNQDEVYSLSNN